MSTAVYSTDQSVSTDQRVRRRRIGEIPYSHTKHMNKLQRKVFESKINTI